MNLTELQREAEWRRCRGSGPTDFEACRYWIETYVKIRHPERGRIPFLLRPAQAETLEAWLANRYNIVLKARQIGYSTLVAAIALWLVLFFPDKYVILLSRGEREAGSLLGKSKYAYKHLPEWMRMRVGKPLQDTLSTLSFAHDSSIVSLPSTQDPARGETAYIIVVDEWASLENPEEAWASIEPVADVGGRVIGLSTAKGSGNFFHRFWQQASNGRGRFKPLFFPWSANSDRDETWYEEKVEDLAATPWILHQEYPRSPEEAFVKSGRSVFDVDLLDSIPPMDPKIGRLWARSDHSRYAEFQEHSDGELRLFEPPVPTGIYAIGADVAEGLDYGDFSSAHVVDPTTMSVCAVWHGHVDPDHFSEVLARLGWWYNAALVGVEVNNHGLTTCVGLQKLRYPRIYYRTSLDQRTNKPTRKIGWRTQSNTKPYVIDALASAVRGNRGVDEEGRPIWEGGLAVRDTMTLSEMKLFVREPDGKTMHGSPYDDRVMSLAIAVEMTKFVHSPQYKVGRTDQWGTLDWWAEQAQSPPGADGWTIGGMSTRKSAGWK